jgi:protein-S-isoprenylcysteine O-methyltransferase Ste14
MRRHKQTKTEQPELENKFNISHMKTNLPQPTVQQGARHLISAALVYGAALVFFTLSPHFHGLLSVTFYGTSALKIYWFVYAAYLVIITPICIFIRPKSLWISNHVRITGYISRVVRKIFAPVGQDIDFSWKPTYEEKHAIVFFIIKIIYGPIAVNAAIAGFNSAVPIFRQFQIHNAPPAVYFDIIYRLFITMVFMIEAIPYIISYHTDSKLLGNKLRYVETNPFHLFVCLACYPPFVNATVEVLGASFLHPFSIVWGIDPKYFNDPNFFLSPNFFLNSNYFSHLNHPMTWILRILAMISAACLLSASLALFTRASNLTNRGIVTWGPYRIVRHPGYVSKNIYWLLSFVPLLASGVLSLSGYIMFLFGYIGWATLYFLRGITEERLLMKDPDYVEYCKKVKYHFIPFVY